MSTRELREFDRENERRFYQDQRDLWLLRTFGNAVLDHDGIIDRDRVFETRACKSCGRPFNILVGEAVVRA